MITKEQEQRLRNWARANRECPRAKKGATQVFCESLRYYYDRQPEEDEQPPIKRSIPAAKGIDVADADLLDEAYRDRQLTNVYRNLLRLYYYCFTSPSVIEQKLSLGQKTFLMHKERAVAKFFEIVDSLEENVLK